MNTGDKVGTISLNTSTVSYNYDGLNSFNSNITLNVSDKTSYTVSILSVLSPIYKINTVII